MRNDFCSDYLEHSAKGSTWKKKGAKYISRVWKNGKWVYEYKITGKGYLKDAQEAKERSKDHSEFAKEVKKESEKLYGSNKSNYSGAKIMDRVYNNNTKKAESYGRKSAEAESNYSTKSLAGNIERGQKKIEKLFSSKTTETIKDTFTGKTRTPDRSGETINIKEASKKNKKKK